jgi:hypothetical protein
MSWEARGLVRAGLLLHRPPAIGIRWWIQLIGHFPFVGIPIVRSLRGAGAPAGLL